MEQRDDRLPLPSEDEGDLNEPPAEGISDDAIIATEEGVPWTPPTDRVLSEPRDDRSGVDYAGTAGADEDELEREDDVQPETGEGAVPRDDDLRADVIEALRASDVVAGDRLRVAVSGSRVILEGEVESVDVLDEILGIVGDVNGVTEVLDEVDVAGI